MYQLTLRSEGGFHSRYTAKYGADWHKGMIYVNNVPGFEYILWHTGNTDESTSGCLILGDSQTSNLVQADGFVGSSVNSYKKVYPIVRDAILSGEKVLVKYVDFDDTGDNEYIAVSGKEPVYSESLQESSQQETEVYDFSKDFPKWPGTYFKVQKPMMKSEELKEWQKAVGLTADGWFGNGSKRKQAGIGVIVASQSGWLEMSILEGALIAAGAAFFSALQNAMEEAPFKFMSNVPKG
jgi:hypothetical protein